MSRVQWTIATLARVCHVSGDEHDPKYALGLRWNAEGAASRAALAGSGAVSDGASRVYPRRTGHCR